MTKTCQNCKEQFTIETVDLAFYEKMQVPPPTFCPLCRVQRRFGFYNIKTLYRRKDSRTEKEIFSSFAPEAPFTVYDHDAWWQDDWDPMEQGREYDFSRPFFEQFFELLQKTPLSSRSILNMVNSDYCNNAAYLKDCYLVFEATNCENCYYGVNMNHMKDSLDISHCSKIEQGYECFMSGNSSRIFFSSHCESSFDVYFSRNLESCSFCFGCVNLRNKSYYIFNRPYSKEEYAKKLQEFDLGSHKNLAAMKNDIRSLWQKFPTQFMEGAHNNSVSGQYIYHGRNVLDSYEIIEGENIRYSQGLIPKTAECYDYSGWGLNAQNVYECSNCGRGIFQMAFCYDCWPDCKNLTYSIQCHSSSDLFGCVGLRKKGYCILNKQYSKEEYEALVPRIISHMNEMPYADKKGRVYRYGEFFPLEFSPFPYNDTFAQEHLPLTKEESFEKGYLWKDPEKRNYSITMEHEALPDHIKDVQDTILKEVIACAHNQICNEQCTQAFRILPHELEFYRKIEFPLPRLCPNCRHYQRIKQRSSLKLWQRKCQCNGTDCESGIYQNQGEHFHKTEACSNGFRTSYSPDSPEIVYCKECYQAEIS